MNLNFSRSKEWHEKMAAIEAEYDVCAGRQIFPRTVVSEPTPTAKPKKPRKPKASKPVAQTRTNRRRSTATKSSGS